MKRWLLLIILFSVFVLALIGESGLLGLFFLAALTFTLLGFFLTWQLFNPTQFEEKVYPPTSPMPDKIHDLHKSLESLGFILSGELRSSRIIIWNYFNEDHTMVAFLSSTGIAGFSSYFLDGLQVTTAYPISNNISNNKLVIRIVKTSLEAAFDYHNYHLEQYVAEHGEPRGFSDLTSLREWGNQQDYKSIMLGHHRESKWRFLFFNASTLALSIAIIVYWVNNSSISLLLMIVCTMLTLVSLTQLPFRRWVESVESRKQREKAEAEAETKPKESLNPFLPPN